MSGDGETPPGARPAEARPGSTGAAPPGYERTAHDPGAGAAGERGAEREPRSAFPIGAAIAFLRRLREALDAGLELPDALGRGATGLPRETRTALDRALRRLDGDYGEDEWGFDEEFAEAAFPLLELMYDRWWRVKTIGVRNVPAHGRALLAANHAGIVPWDATMISVGLMREHPLPRYPRFLVLNWAFDLPFVSVAMRKLGGVVASPYNALRLLEQDQLVAVFPEGVKGTSKSFKDRYRLQRFGRGGFVELALSAGAPIVPVAVVGSEEIYPKIGEAPLLARLTGAPFFPITPTFPLLGPLGVVPLPSKWRIEFCEPIDTSSYGPEAADDRALVFELSERVRETIQEKLYENLVKRGPAFV
jgi:1-acyl-sn-glycerol-3-phosphate acyltransferase